MRPSPISPPAISRCSTTTSPQKIDAVTIEAVPLDVTLFMDTSGSTSGALDRMKRNVASIAAMLRPDDRFRLLTIGLSVEPRCRGSPPAPSRARHERRARHLARLRRARRRARA